MCQEVKPAWSGEFTSTARRARDGREPSSFGEPLILGKGKTMTGKVIAAVLAVALSVSTAVIAWAALRVEPDKENVVASRLEGKWKLNAELTARLFDAQRAESMSKDSYEFRPDPTVAATVPEKYSEFFKDKQVYMAGTFKSSRGGGQEQPFILVSHKGNPHLVYFRPKGEDPMGDAESFNLVIVPAKDRANDLLFVGGDFNNQPFAAYDRVRETRE